MTKMIYSTLTDMNELFENPKEILGGKASGVFDMTRAGLPVPPAFTIPTVECMKFLNGEKGENTPYQFSALMESTMKEYTKLTKHFGYPPLVSVRSGARVSMPGMMDTILNVGITRKNLFEWKDRLGIRAARDCYRRLIQMYGCVVKDIPHAQFEQALHREKQEVGCEADSELSASNLQSLIEEYHHIYLTFTNEEFPDTVEEQLNGSIKAVFNSWNNDRAITYRKLNNYPDDWGTAVTVQSMVFGNFNDNSCSGVLFTRCPSTGAHAVIGEFLPNAQGEDVVAGIRTPLSFEDLDDWNPKVSATLLEMVLKLEGYYKDMQDIEFTVQDGQVYILQTRNGKRSARASFVIACDLWTEKVIDFDTVCHRVSAAEYMILHRPMIDPDFKEAPHFTGIAGGGGIVTGKAMFSSASAINCKEPCILVANETTPEDIEGMHKALGILTSTGGKTSHAAVVARGMNKSCVVGATDMNFNGMLATIKGNFKGTFGEGSTITIDGHTGNVWVGIDVPVIKAIVPAEAERIIDHAFKVNKPLLKTEDLPDSCGGIYIDSSNFEEASGTVSESLGERIHKVLDAGIDVIVDLRPKLEVLPTTDAMIEYMTYRPKDTTQLHDQKIAILSAFKGNTHVSVIRPSTCNLMHKKILKGYKVIPVMNTLEDAFNSTSGIIKVASGKLETVFGSEGALKRFLAMMDKAGNPLTIYEEAMTKNEAIYHILA